MIYLDVCAGISASTVAWAPLGWKAAAYSEIEAAPRAVLAHHYPATPLHGDFTTIGADDYGAIDLLVGGTPCQDFSIAGLRAGMDGARGNLSLEFLRLAGRKRPRWIIWENVPGVLSIDKGRAFGAVLGGLAQLGYGFAYRILDAQFFGVPQRRRRVFVVAYLGDWRCAAAVLFEREGIAGHPKKGREARKIAPTIPSRSSGGGGLGTDFDCDGGLIISGTVYSKWAKGSGGPAGDEVQNLVLATLTSNGDAHSGYRDHHGLVAVPILEAGARTGVSTTDLRAGIGIGEDGDPMFTLQAGKQHAVAFAENSRAELRLEGGDGNVAGALPTGGGKAGQGVPMIHAMGFQSSQSGVREVEAHATLDANNGPRRHNGVFSSAGVRRLTPRECERLQGFPDDYTLTPYRNRPMSDGPRYKMLGNSMAVPVMAWIGHRINLMEQILRAC